MNNRIYLCLAHMSGTEMSYIQEAFDTNWVVPLGPNVNAFEADLERFVGRDKKVVALSAGTAAIHLGLIQLGVNPGDEVICQSFTFCASANPVTYLGATPVFVDSEEETWNMDPALLETAIQDRIKKTGKKPKAIIPVHLYGMPAKMDEILALENYASKFVERETVKKHYFVDNGLLSIFLTGTESPLLENLCAVHLFRKYGDRLYYYSRNSEVDFYVPDEKYAVQACVTLSDADTKDREVSALMKLDRLENLERMVIVTRDEKESIPIPGGRAIEVLPAAEWLLE